MSKTIKTGFISDKINGIKVNAALKCDSDNFNNMSSRKVSYIVMHYTGNKKDTAKANANYFASPDRGASAHLFVDDTSIYQSVELRDIAWHCGTRGTYYHSKCRNSNSIGIEMCCTAGDYKISDITIKNSAYLCAYLCKAIGIKAKDVDKYVLRHYDITHKICPAQMVNEPKEWKEFKQMVKNILENKKVDGTIDSYLVKIISNTSVHVEADKKSKVSTKVKKNEVFTIVDEKDGWGKLKSGAGWIYLKRTKKI